MYKSKIFMKDEDSEELTVLEETEWLEERILQELLAKFPDLIPGDQIDSENPRKWILVSREMSVPNNKNVTGRLSLDHLFLDQDGIPTFVECKREINKQSRREVVAQLLDYAANGSKYWNIGLIRKTASETNEGKDSELIYKLKSDEMEDIDDGSLKEYVEEYWDKVENNLKNHRVRLIFILDTVPNELKSIVEFLNSQMNDVEVLAVEIKRFEGLEDSEKTLLVPRVIGATEKAKELKSKSQSVSTITKQEFLDKCDDNDKILFEEIFKKIKNEDKFTIEMGTKGFSVRVLNKDGQYKSFFHGYSSDSSNNNFRIIQSFIDSILDEKYKEEIIKELLNCDELDDNYNTRVNEKNKNELIDIFNYLVDQLNNIY